MSIKDEFLKLQQQVQEAAMKGDVATVQKLAAEITALQMRLMQGAGAVQQATGGPLLNRVDDKHFEFGSYPQGKNGEVKKILWRVLESKEGRLLLVSEYVLDVQVWNKFNYNQADIHKRTGKKEDILAAVVSWERCDLRKWLNNDFYNRAFGPAEKNIIVERLNAGNGAYTHKDYRPVKGNKVNLNRLTDDTYASYDERGCGDTKDKVFLLNVQEALDFFEKTTSIIPPTVWYGNTDRTARATDYAQQLESGKDVYGKVTYALNPFNGETWESTKADSKKIKVGTEFIGSVNWWLRNIGVNDVTMNAVSCPFHESQAASVSMGCIWAGGTTNSALNYGVRPAILVRE